MIFQQTGRPADAALQYRKVLKRRPGDPVISNNLAWLLATCADPAVRKPSEAIRLAESVCEKSRRKLPSTLDTLAAAYAAAGRFDDAVSTMNEALSLLPSAGQIVNSDVMRDRLLLYKQRMPFIEKGSEAQ